MIDAEDYRVVQFVSSGLLACGLLVTLTVPLLFRPREGGATVGAISSENRLSWSPRGFLGSGPPGKSPVFGLMWGTIYAGQLYLAVAVLIAAFRNDASTDPVALFTACACCFSATSVAAFWTPVFTLNTRAGFVASTVLLIVCALLATTGAISAKAFLNANIYQPFVEVGLTFLGLFAGWTIVASGLSIGITTRVYDRGISSKSASADDAPSLSPLIVSVIVSVLAIVFACPALPLPLFVALFFVRGLFQRWTLWSALAVCAVGIGVGVAMVFVYRDSGGVFW
jgi:hypothetical protein